MNDFFRLTQTIITIIMTIVIIFGLTVFFGAPYVPSLSRELLKMFKKLYPLSKKDLLIDMGAGDGIVLKVAAGFGAKAIGIELHPVLSFLSRIRLRKLGSAAKVVCQNYLDFPFPPETTVVYTFSDSKDIEKIYTKVKSEAKRLKKDLYFISNGFEVPGVKHEKTYSSFYLYKVVAEK